MATKTKKKPTIDFAFRDDTKRIDLTLLQDLVANYQEEYRLLYSKVTEEHNHLLNGVPEMSFLCELHNHSLKLLNIDQEFYKRLHKFDAELVDYLVPDFDYGMLEITLRTIYEFYGLYSCKKATEGVDIDILRYIIRSYVFSDDHFDKLDMIMDSIIERIGLKLIEEEKFTNKE